MGKAIDLTGQRFGRWTVVEKAMKTDSKGAYFWLCQCDCGKTSTVRGTDLRNGNSCSCGCLAREQISRRMSAHRASKSKLFFIWQAMRRRCYDDKNISFQHYGGRGITVCEEWKLSFESFQAWSLQNGYEEGLSIDRIDVNGNYEPNNCHWITKTLQSSNRRDSVWLTFKGETKILTDWADILSINQSTIRERLRRGWSVEDALTVPVGQKRPKG